MGLLLANRSQAQPVVTVQASSEVLAHAGDAGGPVQSFTSGANPFNQTATASVDNKLGGIGTPAVQTATMSLSLTGEPYHIFGSSSGVTTITTLNSSGPFADAHSSFNLVIHLDQLYYYQWSTSVAATGNFAQSQVTLADNLGFPNPSFPSNVVSTGTVATFSDAESGRFGLTGLGGFLQITGGTALASNFAGSASFTFDLVLSATPIPEPSTYAALFGLAALGLAASRRRRRQAG